MPNIVYNGSEGVEPHFSREYLSMTKPQRVSFMEAEQERLLQDVPNLQEDLNHIDPGFSDHAEKSLNEIDAKVANLENIINSL